MSFTGIPVKRIARAVHHIHAHLNEPLAVDHLAELVHMSRTAFFSTFRDVMGSSHCSTRRTSSCSKRNG